MNAIVEAFLILIHTGIKSWIKLLKLGVIKNNTYSTFSCLKYLLYASLDYRAKFFCLSGSYFGFSYIRHIHEAAYVVAICVF